MKIINKCKQEREPSRLCSVKGLFGLTTEPFQPKLIPLKLGGLGAVELSGAATKAPIHSIVCRLVQYGLSGT